ncbi:MAG: WG repeat-containing protein, partial [Verrucomicrobiales bacterium]|nr:WG repeat-containing protein [Verrucomicrobiales bacterium]
SFSEGYCVVDVATSGDSDELSGYIDRSGEIVIPDEFTIANDFSGGLARVQRDRNGPFGFIGYDGSPRFALEFDDAAAQFSEGVAYFRKGEEHMILDRDGTRIGGIDIPSFDGHIGSFSEGLADVAVSERSGLFRRRVSDRCGFVRPNGEVAIPLKFDWVFPFEHGLARVREGKTVGYIDHDGDYVWSTRDWEGY